MTGPTRILITGARAPVALHLCRLLAHDGCKVFLGDSYDHPLSAASNRHSGYIKLPRPRDDLDGYGAALNDAVATHGIDLIIPTCEEVFYLGQLAQIGTLGAPLLAPSMDLLSVAHNKFAFMELAKGYGLDVPHTRLIETRAGFDQTDPKRTVYKPVWSRFASEVLIKPDPRQLAKITPSTAAPWVAQDCVEGDEISVYAIARHGTYLGHAAYRSLFKAGKGAGVCFEPVHDGAVRDWVQTFVEASGWHGQISFDMMRRADGTVVPLECNPRATSGLHFFSDGAAFQSGLWAGTSVRPDVTGILGSRLALWIYGLPTALKTARLGAFRTTLKTMGEILDWPNDHAPVRAQFRALREITKIALRDRVSLQQASTRDIEWNGPNSS